MTTELFVLLFIFTILSFFIGLFLGKTAGRGSRKSDGYLNVVRGDARLVYQLEIVTPPEQLQRQDCIILNVRKVAPTTVVESIEDLQ